MAISEHTHEVLNQPPPIAPYNVFEADTAIVEALEREVVGAGATSGWGVDRLRQVRARGGRGRPDAPRPHAAPHRQGTAGQLARDLDYFVIRRDSIEFKVNYAAYLRSGSKPRIFLLEPGEPFRAIG